MRTSVTVIIILAASSFLLTSCCEKKTKSQPDEEAVLGILYQQQGAEYRALCLQAYNLAKNRVDQSISSGKHRRKSFAVISDLDETALDNSQSEVWLYQHDTTATLPSLRRWWLLGKAGAVPGAVEFFKYAKSKGVDIYYISNRSAEDSVVNATRVNMQHLGFPFTGSSDNKHFLFQQKDSSSSKEYRRRLIAKSHSIIALLGDNFDRS
jgi:5'-nucleotidase (lipoprotein e(P4) family)